MLGNLITLSLLLSSPAKDHIATASLFKNGYAVVVREIPVSGAGDITLTDLPRPSLGTFWITASEGIQIESVVKSTKLGKGMRDATTLDELLGANLGKSVSLGVGDGDELTRKIVEGQLISASGEIVLVRTERGIIALKKSMVTSINSAKGDLDYRLNFTATNPVVDVKLKSSKAGSLYLYGLERGMTWAPSYSVDISDPKSLTLVAKSTVLDDLDDLNDVELKFVTGFPNVPWISFLDPFLNGNSVDEFTGMLGQLGAAPQSNMAFQNGLGGQGGFGGGRREAGGPPSDMQAAFPSNPSSGIQAEDLFFYREPGVSLKRGDRAYYILFKVTAPYEHLYTLDLPDVVTDNVTYQAIPNYQPDVWHSVKFRNSGSQPLTTAPATVFQKGEILGQDTLNYASVGSDVLVRMSRALDIHADQTEEEVSRERGNLRLQNGSLFDLVTLKGTIVLNNFKKEAVKMKISKDLTGELISEDGSPKTSKVAKGLQQINPREHLEWTPTLQPGQKLIFNYSYKLYVRSG